MADEEVLSAHSSSLTDDHFPEYTEEQLQNKIQELLYYILYDIWNIEFEIFTFNFYCYNCVL